ncbi:MAG: lipopolysaccharide biosynthesis protein [Tabrizicola sp.]|jgi:uncharacterized protein involved in exopolysaccharide biosynthesis|nr:lipopolysaccharide biosynthesis protein [Tabrizicola sp.]
MDLKFYLSRFVRRLPYFLLLVVMGSTLGVTVARILPPVYVAEARLVVESEQIPDDLAASTVRTVATEQLQIIQQRILTRDRLIDLAERLQIYAPAPGESAPDLEREEMVQDLRERIRIVTSGDGLSQATLVSVTFKARTAELSAAVTNEVVNLILQENIAMRTSVAGQTLEFFNREVGRLEQELAKQAAEILDFKNANKDALPDSLDFRRAQQAAAQERLLQLDREAAVLKERRTRLIQIYEQTGQIVAEPTTNQTNEERQLQELREEMAQALAVLSPENPRVKLLATQIEALEKAIATQLPLGTSRLQETTDLSVYELQLADIDSQLDLIASQRTQTQIELDALRSSIEATPANALAIDTLERNYTNTRAQYDLAVANRARAETGEVIETLAKGQRISIVEEAIPPLKPQSPKRRLIALAGGMGGIALGLGFVLLLEVMNSSVRRPQDLTAKLGIAPFATIPVMRTTGQVAKHRAIVIASFVLAALAISMGLWAIDTYYQPLDQLLNQLLGRLGLAYSVVHLTSGA